jgi:hypothetical protein
MRLRLQLEKTDAALASQHGQNTLFCFYNVEI